MVAARRHRAKVERLTVLGVIAMSLSACAPAPRPFSIAPRRIVDLSPTISEDLLVRTRGERQLRERGRRGTTKVERLVKRDPYFVFNAFVELYDHAGAHADSPNHVIENGATVDELPLEGFFGRARVFDFSSRARGSPIVAADLVDQGIEPGDIVIVHIGYEPPGPEDLPAYPYLSAEAAEYLAGIPIKAFASDMPSTGSFSRYGELAAQGLKGSANVLPEHYALLSRGVQNIEGLINLGMLVGETDVVFVGFPLKLAGVSGGPMRAVALVY